MAVNGKWVLTSVEGLKEFYDAINSPEEHRAKVRALAPELKANPGLYVEEITVDKAAGKIHRKVTIKGEVKRDLEVPIGVDFDTTAPDGRPVKIRVHLEGDGKATVHEKGAGFEFTTTITLVGDVLTLINKCGSVQSVMKYKRA